MRKISTFALLAFWAALFSSNAFAQTQQNIAIQSLSEILPGAPKGSVDYDLSGHASGTNLFVQYLGTTLMADSLSLDENSGDCAADGHVTIQQESGEIWVGEHIDYNFKTHQMRSQQFRTGKAQVFVSGENLSGDLTNKTYNARRTFVTTDDISDPTVRIRASSVRIVPGKYIEAWNAVLLVDGVPAFYFPYYKRNIGPHANNWNFIPGYRSEYGGFLLADYKWWYDDSLDGKFHFDYRAKRGPGIGPDLNMHFGQWGDAQFKYYYTHDKNPDTFTNALVSPGSVTPNRQRLYFGWQATPYTNLNLKALVNYQNDPLVLHDFFEGEYDANPQPQTFFEANKYSDNWSLDVLTTPRLNSFFDQVERLPDVKLTGLRQQIFDTPLYYDSESSMGYYEKYFADTNGFSPNVNFNYSAVRFDTYHQVLLPWTFFNWLNVSPRVGGRFTYYGTANGPGATTSSINRGVFNTGTEMSFKASQLWVGATNSLLQIDGLRHIVEPSINYVFVPNPSAEPARLPQFDSELPSPLLLPVQFPDYNNIDSIDSQNVLRLGLRNTLQTKRGGQLENLLDWNVLTDWRIIPNSTQQRFSDIYNDVNFRPRSWILLTSQTRYDVNTGHFNLASHRIALTPGDRWSWAFGHYYSRPGFVDSGDNYLTSTALYKLNENWGFRAEDDFNARTGLLQNQYYTIYRDLRSWTGALTFRVVDNGGGLPKDYTVAIALSLKATPNARVGNDTGQPHGLVGQ